MYLQANRYLEYKGEIYVKPGGCSIPDIVDWVLLPDRVEGKDLIELTMRNGNTLNIIFNLEEFEQALEDFEDEFNGPIDFDPDF